MNVIKHIPEHVDRELLKSRPLPSNMQELQQNLLHIWQKLDQAAIQNIMDLMTSWVQVLYDAKQHAVGY